MTAPSLRTRLLIGLVSAIGLIWIVTALLSYRDANHEIDELFDAQLAQSAKVLLAQASHELQEGGLPGKEIETERGGGGHKYEQKIAFQIWDRNGELLLRSAAAPTMPLSQRDSGFDDTVVDGRQWRVFTHWDAEREFRISVAERHDVRHELAGHIAFRLLYPLVIALPLLAVLIWFGIGAGLRPLRRITREVARRAPGNLDRLETGGVPQEIRPLADSLNSLLGRVEGALENERRFTADAAHELRTPLAALRTQAQVALRAGEDGVRRHALESVIQGVDRATHLVEQLLTLARLDPRSAAARHEPVDLAAVAETVLAALGPSAVDKAIDLSLETPGPVPVSGDETMLGVLLRNLVDNAIRYTPRDGSVRVSVAVTAGRAELTVTDTGPGIAAEERERVMERFYRALGTGESGSGLGLSIVKRIAELHGAEVFLESPEEGKGLRIRVAFGQK
jgi:two-component system sensor histidine kinase QseC